MVTGHLGVLCDRLEGIYADIKQSTAFLQKNTGLPSADLIDEHPAGASANFTCTQQDFFCAFKLKQPTHAL